MEDKYCLWNNPVDPIGFKNSCPYNKKYLCCHSCNSKTCEWRCKDNPSTCGGLTNINLANYVRTSRVFSKDTNNCEKLKNKKKLKESLNNKEVKLNNPVNNLSDEEKKKEKERIARKARREARKARKKLEELYNKLYNK